MQLNSSNREIIAKIVYYGPARCGKTTNLQEIHGAMPTTERGRLFSTPSREDITMFFDLMALQRGTLNGYSLRFQLYTVPGQPHYNATRKLVLRGVDGIVFVADSDPARQDANEDSMQNLYDNLSALDLDPRGLQDPLQIPFVIQYNKRDRADAASTDLLQERLNPDNVPAFRASAIQRDGVFETLEQILSLTEKAIATRMP